MRLAVVGDSGLMGQSAAAIFASRGADTLGISRSFFRGGNFWPQTVLKKYRHESVASGEVAEIFDRLKAFKAELVINCAAMVDLAACEKEPEAAMKLNAVFAGELAWRAAEAGMAFIHLSTDQVFDGKKGSPYAETDTPRPLHVYGRTKLAGEEAVRKRHKKALVARTNIVGFRDQDARPVFAEWLCGALSQKQIITLAEDFVTSPIHVDLLSDLLWRAHEKALSGVTHLTSWDSASKYDFGRRLAGAMGADFSQVIRGKLSDLKMTPERPKNVSLDTAKAGQALQLAGVEDTIARLAKDHALRKKERLHA